MVLMPSPSRLWFHKKGVDLWRAIFALPLYVWLPPFWRRRILPSFLPMVAVAAAVDTEEAAEDSAAATRAAWAAATAAVTWVAATAVTWAAATATPAPATPDTPVLARIPARILARIPVHIPARIPVLGTTGTAAAGTPVGLGGPIGTILAATP